MTPQEQHEFITESLWSGVFESTDRVRRSIDRCTADITEENQIQLLKLGELSRQMEDILDQLNAQSEQLKAIAQQRQEHQQEREKRRHNISIQLERSRLERLFEG